VGHFTKSSWGSGFCRERQKGEKERKKKKTEPKEKASPGDASAARLVTDHPTRTKQTPPKPFVARKKEKKESGLKERTVPLSLARTWFVPQSVCDRERFGFSGAGAPSPSSFSFFFFFFTNKCC